VGGIQGGTHEENLSDPRRGELRPVIKGGGRPHCRATTQEGLWRRQKKEISGWGGKGEDPVFNQKTNHRKEKSKKVFDVVREKKEEGKQVFGLGGGQLFFMNTEGKEGKTVGKGLGRRERFVRHFIGGGGITATV